MATPREMLAQLPVAYGAMSKRERRMVTAAAGAVLAFIVFIILFSFASTAASIRSRTEMKLRKLDDIQTLAQSYREAEQRRAALEQQLQASNVKLITLLEEKGQRAGLEIPTLNPKPDAPLDGDKIVESSVELTLTDVKLNRLLDFLRYVEEGPGIVKVKYLRLEPRPQAEALTAWVLVSSYHPKN